MSNLSRKSLKRRKFRRVSKIRKCTGSLESSSCPATKKLHRQDGPTHESNRRSEPIFVNLNYELLPGSFPVGGEDVAVNMYNSCACDSCGTLFEVNTKTLKLVLDEGKSNGAGSCEKIVWEFPS